MRNLLLGLGILGICGAVSACGGDDKAKPISPDTTRGGTGGTGNTGKSGSSNTSGDAGAGGGETEGGPAVTILSPSPAATPSDGVLSADTVEVRCQVKQASASAPTVDRSSVRLSLTNDKGVLLEEKDASTTTAEDEYAADFVLTTVSAGQVSFTCSASDNDKAESSDTVSTFVDHGPTITVIGPLPDSSHPVVGGMAVEFQVAPMPLVDDDAGADVATVAFSFDGKKYDLEEVEPGRFKTVLPIDDPDPFPTTPRGAITIEASNGRAVTAVESYNVLIDGEGPTIEITAPNDKAVVGGPVTLEFIVSDPASGVDPESVNVTLYLNDQDPQFFDPNKGWTRDAQKYTYTFDTKEVEKFAKVQTTINVHASDEVGNASASGQSLVLYLDNVPPQVDLDPLNIRTKAGSTCSGSFDPVGDGALSDLDGQFGRPLVTRIDRFRAFVYERTNSIPGQKEFFHSLTDQEQVRLFFQADPGNAPPGKELLINKNPTVDDFCDDIGAIADVNGNPAFGALKPLPGNTGSPWNKADPGVIPSIPDTCTLVQASEPKPQNLCPAQSSDMWFFPYYDEIDEPLVYVYGTPSPNDLTCSGIQTEFLASGYPEGWVCLAARAVDNAGNIGISPPIRVCVDDPDTEDYVPPCRTEITTPPTCTDGCTPPARGGNLIIVNL